MCPREAWPVVKRAAARSTGAAARGVLDEGTRPSCGGRESNPILSTTRDDFRETLPHQASLSRFRPSFARGRDEAKTRSSKRRRYRKERRARTKSAVLPSQRWWCESISSGGRRAAGASIWLGLCSFGVGLRDGLVAGFGGWGLVAEELAVDLGKHEDARDDGGDEHAVPEGRPAERIGDVRDDHLADGGDKGARSVDETDDGAEGLLVAGDGRMFGEVGGDGGGDDVVGAADEDAHGGEDDHERRGVEHVGEEGHDHEERAEDDEEDDDDAAAAAAEGVRDDADDDAAGHHAEIVEGRDEVGLVGWEVGLEEEREPEEDDVVDRLHEAKGDAVARDGGNAEGGLDGDGGASHGFLRDGVERGGLGGGSLGRRGGEKVVADHAPAGVDDDGPHEAPPPGQAGHVAEDDNDGRDDVAKVLVRGPGAVDEATVLLGRGGNHPVAHDGGPDRAADGLEEAEDEIDDEEVRVNDEKVHRGDALPDAEGEEEDAHRRAVEADPEDLGRVVHVAQLARERPAEGVREHEAGVHATEDQRRQALLDHDVLHVRVALPRQVVRRVLDPGQEVHPCLHAQRHIWNRHWRERHGNCRRQPLSCCSKLAILV
mmetsp:Transcript_2066/g.6280  ORF Transcript_2066/g.6280 Transcript_2066/m.6280 type:complete len:601 (+) Transcript_2066:232-2034(+)